MEGKTASPPYDPSVPQYQEYLEGYHAETARRVAEGITPFDPPFAEDTDDRDPARAL